ncbi:conjugal transfer protein TraF [Vibrio albus]|uniref:Conjugal transfer protein TraF n=1 Tax=Vibrio albus TaxID=2200953 RepID=A0A2U3B669_9VIBR|nr:conjugal transfer protein TraF [Vibrio albus]PWI32289.1 conjugal transfer protein TraF [Vibrio albus]
MITKNKLAVGVCLALCSGTAFSAAKVADGRGNAMGNTGVASADYLMAPFYNPALTGLYRDNDDVGLLLPGVQLTANDQDDTLSDIDDLQDAIDNFDSSTSSSAAADELNGYLDALQGNDPLSVNAGAGVAVAIPNKYIAANLFGSGYVEVVAATQIVDFVDDPAQDDRLDTVDRYKGSTVNLMAFGYSEVGVALAKPFTIAGQEIMFGVSPKFQRLKTYAQNIKVEDFDIDDYDQSERSKTAFNLDLGAAWAKDAWRVGFAVKNVIKQSIDTDASQVIGTYELSPQATVAGAYVSRFFTASVDLDLTKQTRFEDLDIEGLSDDFDDTQFVRFGVEGNAWDWLQLRAGYEVDMLSNVDNAVTAGLGFSPFDVVNIDIAGSYSGENQFGASASLAFTF